MFENMDPGLRKRWADRVRSGPLGYGALCTTEKEGCVYCAMGHLAEILVEDGVIEKVATEYWSDGRGYFAYDMLGVLKTHTFLPRLLSKINISDEEELMIVHLNDTMRSPEEIADFIEGKV